MDGLGLLGCASIIREKVLQPNSLMIVILHFSCVLMLKIKKYVNVQPQPQVFWLLNGMKGFFVCFLVYDKNTFCL